MVYLVVLLIVASASADLGWWVPAVVMAGLAFAHAWVSRHVEKEEEPQIPSPPQA